MIRIKVPASTANFGAGFDCIGASLDLYNCFEFEEVERDLVFLEQGKASKIPINENLIYKSMKQTFEKYNYVPKGLYINVTESNIPISRGLGSSASCIAAGVAAANFFMGNLMDMEEIINTAAQIEGHPDNVVPALVGGMVVAIMQDNGKIVYSKVNISDDINFIAIIPDYKVDTMAARKVLPDYYSRKHCVYNISRASMLVSAINNGEYDKIRICLEDKLHQPYRKPLLKNVDTIFKKSEEFGSLGDFISGSGPTIMAIVKKENRDYHKRLCEFFEKENLKVEVKVLHKAFEGLRLDII